MTLHAHLANLFAWSLQVAVLIAAGGALPGLLRVRDPGVRHLHFRTLLIVCLLLPAVQPWQATGSVADSTSFTSVGPIIPSLQPSADPAPPINRWPSLSTTLSEWPAIASSVLIAGALIRLTWIAAGVLRLRRLRSIGEPMAWSENDERHNDIERLRIDVRCVPSLRQPVTFGLLRPVVMLPATFDALSPGARHAILEHELWHVRRRDWLWLVAEEIVRAILWFHPAIAWLISRIQTSREEVVDELTVLATNERRSYLEALLAFADEPSPFPAAPFARRRHLFHRMVLISREAVMSSRRIAASFTAMAVVVIGAATYGVSAFPLKAAPTSAAAQGAAAERVPASGLLRSRDSLAVRGYQQPPRPDPKAAAASSSTAREAELKQTIASSSRNAGPYLELARLQEDRGAVADAEATFVAARTAMPNNTPILTALAQFYSRRGEFDRAISTLEEVAAIDPSDPARQQLIATFYWDKVFKDASLSSTAKLAYIQSGIAATDRALAINSEYVEALTYKSIFLRMQANMTRDSAAQQKLIAEADRLRNRAMELRHTYAASLPPPPPPPPPPGGSQTSSAVGGQAAVRVGGNIKPPTKTKHVTPVYPPEAEAAKVTGVVIIEAMIDQQGRVSDARVLRSIPLLDQAAVEAVRQWEFEPTFLNGQAVPVVMTVTVNFSLQ
jgi:TonB family protein